VCASVIFAQPPRNQGRRENLSRSDFPPGTKFIALTFDDGPNTTYTVQVLDELKRLGAHASFYIQGQKVNAQTIPILQRMVAEGHDIDNHSWDHPTFGRTIGTTPQLTTPEAARENLRKTSQAIFDATRYWPFSFRAPFLEWGTQAHGGIDILSGLDREMAMAFIDTGIDPGDFDLQGNPQGIAGNILNRGDAVLDGGIILLHDCGGSRPGTVASLQHFIPQLQARNFEIVTVRELFMIKNVTPELFADCRIIPSGGGSGMHPRVNQRAEMQSNAPGNWRQWRDYERLWPDNTDDWWRQDWWSCTVAPWNRNLSQPCSAPSVIPQSRDNVRTAASSLQINGFRAGNLSLDVANSGMYNISIHDVSGKMLAQTNANLAAGVNSLQIGQNIARGVVIVRIQGANANLVRRVSVR